jgi:hypothetical protein
MDLSTEQLDMLEMAGQSLLDINQAAIIIEVEPSWLSIAINDKNTAAHKRYWKGYFISMMKVRKSIIELAERGSFPAQQLLQKIVEKQG